MTTTQHTLAWIARLFQRKPRHVYGRIERPDGVTRENVRQDTRTGRVQFVLHRAGEQGHAEDYWHDMGYGWEEYFVPDAHTPAIGVERRESASPWRVVAAVAIFLFAFIALVGTLSLRNDCEARGGELLRGMFSGYRCVVAKELP